MKTQIESLLSVEHDSKSVGAFQQNYLRQLQLFSQNGAVASQLNRQSCKSIMMREPSKIFICKHLTKKHYAKNMCHNCYHSKGKTKLATKCEHTNKPHYSNGKCQNCYLADYYIKKKEKLQPNANKRQRRESNTGLTSTDQVSDMPKQSEGGLDENGIITTQRDSTQEHKSSIKENSK